MNPLTKFGFKIKTRNGLIVDNLLIQAVDQAEAERRLMQMYMQCEVLEVRVVESDAKAETTDLDGIISLISKQDPPQNPS
jgi:hypothetical protein